MNLLDCPPEALTGRTVAELAHELLRVRKARQDLAAYHDLVEDELAARMPEWQVQIDGVKLIRHGGKKRSAWDHDALFDLALARARSHRLTDPLTGETEDPAEAALRIVREAAQPDYWRKGVLKGWGVQVDEFCKVSWGRKTVEITGG